MKFRKFPKVMQLNYSFLLTIPMIWAKANDLRKGQRLKLILQENGDITIKKPEN